jgi:hypothetical protein
MIEQNNMYEGNPITSKCCCCGKELTDKWIQYTPFGDFCINCAQKTMRILLQDIIEYHNNVSVSLLDIFHHGDPRKTTVDLETRACQERISDIDVSEEIEKMLGTCPISGIIGMFTPGNWYDTGVSEYIDECIACDCCMVRCDESRLPSGYENENGRYHGGYCYPKNGFVIFQVNK